VTEQAAVKVPPLPPSAAEARRLPIQTLDFTTLAAATHELQAWVPAKVEAVVQQECSTALRLRTPAQSGESRRPAPLACCGHWLDADCPGPNPLFPLRSLLAGWLYLCYHARYAYLGTGEAPARGSAADLFSFAQQLQAALRGLVLTAASMPSPYERVVKLAFAQRPGDPVVCQLVFECAGYSNLLLVAPDDTVLAAAHQVRGSLASCPWQHDRLGCAFLYMQAWCLCSHTGRTPLPSGGPAHVVGAGGEGGLALGAAARPHRHQPRRVRRPGGVAGRAVPPGS
jgi:hypothetical protein